MWHFGPACVTFRPGLCDILALSCVTKASACHHTPILTTGAVYRKFHRSSVSKTNLTTIQQFHRVIADSCYCVTIILTAFKHFDMKASRYRVTSTASLDNGIVRQQFHVATWRNNGSSTRNGSRFDVDDRHLSGKYGLPWSEIKTVML